MKDAVENILMADCGACHGPDAPAPGSAGIQFIGDVDRLVAAGLIVPLSSVTSPVVRVSVVGSMPPPSSGLPAITDADIATLVTYIDNPRSWPEFPTSAAVDAGMAAPAVDDVDAVEAVEALDAGVDGG